MLLLAAASLLHQRTCRRFVLLLNSTDCYSTHCFVSIRTRNIQYGRREARTEYFVALLADVYERVMRCWVGWRMEMFVFLVFAASSFSSLKIGFSNTPHGSTVALLASSASSCIPVRPYIAITGMRPPRRSPLVLFHHIAAQCLWMDAVHNLLWGETYADGKLPQYITA